MAARLSLLVFALLSGCGVDRLWPAAGGLEVLAERVEFGHAFIGHPVVANVAVRNTSRARRAAALTIEAPFTAAASIEVEAGDTLAVELRFNPEQAGEAQGALTVSTGEAVWVIPLRGAADEVPDCVASGACRASSFDGAAGACFERVLPDDTACSAERACVEAARCASGVCLGLARACDDGDLCTLDACDSSSGCLHLPAVCPPSGDPCKVAACDPARGCGLADAPDGTACGAADCVTAQVCLSGECQAVAVPEGHTCRPASPCQEKGICHAQVCVQPAPSALAPAWTYLPRQGWALYFNGLADASGNLYWVECPNTGPCELVSVTRDGALRYRVPMAVATLGSVAWGPEGLLALIGGNIISAVGLHGLEARRASDGALVWVTDLIPALAPHLGPLPNLGAGGSSIVDDGQGGIAIVAYPVVQGTHELGEGPGFLASLSAVTGAVRWVKPITGDLIAIGSDEAGNLYGSGVLPAPLATVGASSTLFSWSPSGVERWRAPAVDLIFGLSVSSGRLVVADRKPAHLRATANGAPLGPAARDGGGDFYSPVEAVLDSTAGYEFFEPPSACCPTCACQTNARQPHLRGFALSDDAALWDAPVDPTASPAAEPPLVSEAALTQSGDLLYARGPRGGPYSVSEPARLEAVTTGGAPKFSCTLPGPLPWDSILYAGAAVLVPGRWVAVAQPQCFGCSHQPDAYLVAFDVPGYALATHGWVSQRGSSARAGRPR